MYVATFYSFKGGVGRTMAVANVAVQLAELGRRVLIVDFDLEAPGLDTLALSRPPGIQFGIVDFVTHYLAHGEVPDVSNYVYEATGVGRDGGRLYVMPAGRSDDAYGQRLNQIDWGELYAEHDGYVMFEDMKAQWSQKLAPDYVLIDSRTGHTDVAGICTRQLPDAVVILFIPNDQNFRGLQKIVRDIRAEARTDRRKRIELLFVMSNVPDLDDEEDILAGRRRTFEQGLGIELDHFEVIHRYDSLALLNQSIFTKERPRSRLAREYLDLARRLMKMNPEDREGALSFLADLHKDKESLLQPPGEVEHRLDHIQDRHSHDPEIAYALSRIRLDQGRIGDALSLLDAACTLARPTPELLLERASLRVVVGDTAGAVADAEQILSYAEADLYTIDRAIRMLRLNRSAVLGRLAELPSVRSQSPDAVYRIGQQLRWSSSELETGAALFRSLIYEARVSDALRNSARSELAFNLIGMGVFSEAIAEIQRNATGIESMRINDAFNFGMASWASTGEPPGAAFDRVLHLWNEASESLADANVLQCIAVAYFVSGNEDAARQAVHRARNAITHGRVASPSCWRYLMVPVDQFLKDLDSMVAMIDGTGVRPVVLRSGIREEQATLS